jgi:hypothetical protein
MINVESKLLEALKASSCFGIAHDDTVPECKQCDVKAQCKQKAEGAFIAPPKVKPKTETAATPATTANKPSSQAKKPADNKPAANKTQQSAKPEANKTSSTPKAGGSNPAGAPDFKAMTLPELKALASQRSVEWKDYGNESITRMRLIMVLKKSYE